MSHNEQIFCIGKLSEGDGPPVDNLESEILQLDGNISICTDSTITKPHQTKAKHVIAQNLPIVASFNARSLHPKIDNFKTDLLHRNISIACVCEVWEQIENKNQNIEYERMFEMNGLKFLSRARKDKRGGGVAIVVDTQLFTCQRLEVTTPNTIETVWSLVKPKKEGFLKEFIVCSFYSPPGNGKNSKLVDHIVGTIQELCTKYPNSGIFICGDKNGMDIKPILNSGLKLKQIVDKPTRKGKILDVIITNIGKYYNSPIIAPPLRPDDPDIGKESDHFVPVIVPHTDKFNPPIRNYKVIKYRLLPANGIREFGQWITRESWDELNCRNLASDQVTIFENLINSKLDQYCPVKTVKIGSQDKPWINAELKKIHRQRNREYCKNGKSLKYQTLNRTFEENFKKASEKYLQKNVCDLMDSNPSKAYRVLKKLGARPGDCTEESNTFTLPEHERMGLSPKESSELIANHFANISQMFPPLSIESLPERVQEKIQKACEPPNINEYEVMRKIEAAKKPQSGVPGDLPRELVKEFSVELAVPVCKILKNIFTSAQWPENWRKEYITPIAKITEPETEDDLRPISLTNFFSKVAENFVVSWLLEYVGNQIDFRQYGGMKGNSTSHYLIEFINFILYNQEAKEQTAVLACMVDFSKAYNRTNHNILITKLSDMGCPGWLLKIVMAFLTNRSMVVRYKGEQSSERNLPGSCPQGTLLGLFLFLILINDAGFDNQENNTGELITCKRNIKEANEIHLKFVDDLTLGEAIDLKKQLVFKGNRQLPDNFHSRTGHILPEENSRVCQQLHSLTNFADNNEMLINYKKTKFILFNNAKNLDFEPNFEINGQQIELVDVARLLGVIVRSDLKWCSNTEDITKKGFKRLWMLRRLKALGATQKRLVDVLVKQVRSLLEIAVPVWHSGLTVAESKDIERVQKAGLQVILGPRYKNYENALAKCGLKTLNQRRVELCTRFAKKSAKHEKHRKWFVPNLKTTITRSKQPKYCPVFSRTVRFDKSPLSYLTKLLNQLD